MGDDGRRPNPLPRTQRREGSGARSVAQFDGEPPWAAVENSTEVELDDGLPIDYGDIFDEQRAADNHAADGGVVESDAQIANPVDRSTSIRERRLVLESSSNGRARHRSRGDADRDEDTHG